MKRIAILLLMFPVLGSLALTGCDYVFATTIDGSGNEIQIIRADSGFDSIEVSKTFVASITISDNFSVMLEIDENVEEYLDVIQEGTTLKIRLDPSKSYRIRNAVMHAEITMPELRELDLSGASAAHVLGLNSDIPLKVNLSGASRLSGTINVASMELDVSGASDVDLLGASSNLDLSVSGASKIDFTNFITGDTKISASGASNVTLFCDGRLDVNASGASTVTYSGNPTLGDIDSSGGSRVRPQ
jgi:hypothetical protein